MSDQDLVQRIFSDYHDAIDAAATGAKMPAALLGGIVANESGGNADAARFEPAVFASIGDVLMGRKTFYNPPGCKHPLGMEDFIAVINPGQLSPSAQYPPAVEFQTGLARMELMATSRGLTQIMGWHCVEFAVPLTTLSNPATHLKLAAAILAYFDQRYNIVGLSGFGTPESSALFTCWNTGKPDGKTFDPQYVPNGLNRMKIYQALIDAASLHET